MNLSKLVLAVSVCFMFLVSCSNEDNVDNTIAPLESYYNGVWVLNQGGFGKGDASVSYVSSDFLITQNDIFSVVNPMIKLGDTAQDIGFYNEYAYVVLNVSNKIEIVNRYTMKSIATISEGLDNPRYIAFANGKGYVTNWGDGGNPDDDFVAVIDLVTHTVTSKTPVAEGPERIVENEGKLYIAHLGGFGFGNSISVINSFNNTVSTTIKVGDVPNAMQIKDDFLWVSCSGNPSYVTAPLVETPGSLVKINLSNYQVESTIAYANKFQHIAHLIIDDTMAYYTVDAGIYKFDLTATVLPTAPVFSTTAQGVYSIYSFAINNDNIYVGDAGDFTNNGKIHIYGKSGILQNTFSVGVVPAGFYFNE